MRKRNDRQYSALVENDDDVERSAYTQRETTAHRRVEHALRESEERFAAFMRHMPGAAWIKAMTGRYLYANPEAELVFNVSLENLRGKMDEEVFPPETAQQFRENDRRALDEGDRFQTIEALLHPDNVVHRSMVRKFTIPGLDGRPAYIAGIAFDITERLAAEDALRASEERFRRMADSAPIMIWMSGTDKECTWFNRNWLRFTGRELSQELGHGWVEGVHPDDRERCLEIYADAFDRRESFDLEYRLRRYDGDYRWILDAGVPLISDGGDFTGYIGSCKDITDRRRVEELLRGRVRERAEELAVANERLREEILYRRRAESLLSNENRILELVATGIDLRVVLEALSESIVQLMPGSWCVIRLMATPSDAGPIPNGSKAIDSKPVQGVNLFGSQAAIGTPPPFCTKRTIVETVNGHRIGAGLRRRKINPYWLEPIAAPSGDLLGVLAVYGDSDGAPGATELASGAAVAKLAALAIERTRSEERARQQLSHLAHVSRLATMGEMASGLAHELNQPLCAIVNYTEACVELVNSKNIDANELKKALGDVAKQAERAGEVIRRLREFVRRREPERRAVDLNAVVHEVMAIMNSEARRNEIDVRLKLGDRPVSVLADPIQIQQVLVNLIRNAFDAMCGTTAGQRVLTIRTSRQKDLAEVFVSDTGTGIPEPLREKLFDPFFSTKRDGMGMGLSISRSILELHHGRIWATPNGARGTTFRFTLPVLRSKKP